MMNDNFIELPLALFAAVDSRYIEVADLVDLSELFAKKSPSESEWLRSLALCGSEGSVLTALRERILAKSMLFDEKYVEFYTGLLFSRFRRGLISRSELSEQLVDLVDAYNFSDIDLDDIQNQIFRDDFEASDLYRRLHTMSDYCDEYFRSSQS